MESSKVVKIGQKIVSQRVLLQEEPATFVAKEPVRIPLSARERPEELRGKTIKIKPPASDHAYFITINDIVEEAGTDKRVPYEVFINTKDAVQHQWVTAVTLLLSAVFRKGGDVTFVVNELKSIFDPQGGYFKNGRLIPSVLYEIAEVLEHHFYTLGLLKSPEISAETAVLIAEKKEKLDETQLSAARLCPKCSSLSLVRMDGCDTCLSCGDSKCG